MNGLPVKELLGEENFHWVPSKHILPEDCHAAIAENVAAIPAGAD